MGGSWLRSPGGPGWWISPCIYEKMAYFPCSNRNEEGSLRAGRRVVWGPCHGSMAVRKSVYCHGRVQVSGGRVVPAFRASTIGKILSMIMVVALMAATVVSGMTKESRADDNWLVNAICGSDLGLNTSWQPVVKMGSPQTDDETDYNKMTMQDVYGGRLSWTTFNGTKQPGKIKDRDGNDKYDNILSVGGTATNNGVIDRLDSDIFSGADDVHDFSCPIRAAVTMFSGTILGLADMISDFTSLFVEKAVDPNFICDDPANPEGMCINLLAVIAGKGNTGSDGGIIGRLFDGMYSGLIVMVFAAVGVWAAWTGLIKRKLTSALSGIAWGVAIFGVGVFFMSEPLLLAKLPMQVGTSLGGCVVMGMNGKNCMSSSDGSPDEPSDNTECFADTSETMPLERAMALNAKMASCKVWKAFVWEPWVAGQFGASYNELFTGGSGGDAGPLFSNSKTKDNLDYWKNIEVGLYSGNKRMDDMCAATKEGRDQGYNYSNVALYQANLQAEQSIHACGTPYHQAANIKSNDQTYGDWIWIIDAMTQARSTQSEAGADNLSIMWASWTGNNYMGRLQVAFIALLAAIMGAAVLITTAVLAMVYLFMSVLLTAFAPLFFLMGVMPGQGKKLFLGWVEKMVSNTLKYFGCVLWMMVTLELYAAVLGNANTNIGMTFVFTIIVTLAMWLYRGEFLKMIGRANFGGTQFSNSMSEWMKNKGKSVKDTALATGAGYVGGIVAGRSAPKKKINRKKIEVGQMHNGVMIRNQAEADAANKERKRQNAENRAFNRAHGRRAGARDGAMYQLNQSMKGKGGVLGQAAIVNDRIRDDRRNRNRRRSEDQKKQIQQAKEALAQQTEGLGVVEAEELDNVSKNAASEQDAVRRVRATKGYRDTEQKRDNIIAKYGGSEAAMNATIQGLASDTLASKKDADALRQGAVGTALSYGKMVDEIQRISTNDEMTKEQKELAAKKLSDQYSKMLSDSSFATVMGSGASGDPSISADDIRKMATNDPTLDADVARKITGMRSTFEADAMREYSANEASGVYGITGATSFAQLAAEDDRLQNDLNAKQSAYDTSVADMKEVQGLADAMNLTDLNAVTAFNLEQGTKAIDARAEKLNSMRLGWGANKKDMANMDAAEKAMEGISTVDSNGDVQVNMDAINSTFGSGSYKATPRPVAPTGTKAYGVGDTVDIDDVASGAATFDATGGGDRIDPRRLSGQQGNRGRRLE